MSRYDLSVDIDYVPQWTVVDGVRELFQNALDEETAKPENKMFFEYDAQTQTLRVGNKQSTLAKNTLLLGRSTKRDDKDLIGQQGEGYKIATVVLLRTGHGVKIYNYGEKELWKARIVKSRKYKVSIVSFDIEKYVFKKVPDNNLVFEITGVTEQEYAQIVAKNLNLVKKEDLGEVYKTVYGKLLVDAQFKGHIYVSGLYVTSVNDLAYGYDFKPSLIKLNRDRNLVDNYNIRESCARVLRCIDNPDIVEQALNNDDGTYYGNVVADACETKAKLDNSTKDIEDDNDDDYCEESSTDYVDVISSKVAEKFEEQYGVNAYPVTYEFEKESAKDKGYIPVITSSATRNILTSYSNFSPKPVKRVTKASYDLEELTNSIKDKLTSDEVSKLEEILIKVKKLEYNSLF
jgi:hypothetical protein